MPTSDPIKGVWKLNLDKSKYAIAVPESEVITIVAQDGSYKLTFDEKNSNGYNPRYDIVTDMKGGIVKPVMADGRARYNNEDDGPGALLADRFQLKVHHETSI